MNDRSAATLGRIARLALVGLLVALAATGPAAAHTGDDGAHHHDGWMGTHGGMGWGMGWGLWFLWPTLLLLVAGAAAYYLLSGADTGGDGHDAALETLRERYARGDIDEEEFERRRERLQTEQS